MYKKIIYLLIFLLIAAALVILAGVYVDKNVKLNLGQSSASNPAANFSDYGLAPEFPAGDNWLNSVPLTMAELKGKVVLIDFWTYSCINCIRTLPYVTNWYDAYKDKGLVVIGVHTPEFTFEHDADNVKNAIAQFKIHYPVVQDNDYAIWSSYNNEYWPAEYLIDQQGEIVEENFGEGNYSQTEKNIMQLLGIKASSSAPVVNDNLDKIGSPEMYFGTDRLKNLTAGQQPSNSPKSYQLQQNLSVNNFSLGGTWQFSGQNVRLSGSSGRINLKFHSGKIFIVASSSQPAELSITVDGKPQPPVTVQAAKLYTLFDSQDYSDHLIEININQSGFQAFTFTFG
jgi:thiol-disulfide isomerase/thioredoxin